MERGTDLQIWTGQRDNCQCCIVMLHALSSWLVKTWGNPGNLGKLGKQAGGKFLEVSRTEACEYLEIRGSW